MPTDDAHSDARDDAQAPLGPSADPESEPLPSAPNIPENQSADPSLSRLVERWPTLPEATKAKIIALADEAATSKRVRP